MRKSIPELTLFFFSLAAMFPLWSSARASDPAIFKAVKEGWKRTSDAYENFQLSIEINGIAYQQNSVIAELSGKVDICRHGTCLRVRQPEKQLGMGSNDELIDCKNSYYSFQIGRIKESGKWVLLGIARKEDNRSDDFRVDVGFQNNLEFFHPLNIAGVDLPAFFERPDISTQFRALDASDDVELTFEAASPLSPENPPFVSSGKILLSKEHNFSPIEVSLRQDHATGDSIPFTFLANYELVSIDGNPVRKSFESTRTRSDSTQQKDVFKVSVSDAIFAVNDEIFYVSHYGLPEPKGYRPSKAVWWLAGGGIIFICVCGFTYLFFRQKAQ